MDCTMRLRVLGTRGSCPSGGEGRSLFGCSTSCYMLETEERVVFLDAGSGLLNAPEEALRGREIAILLSHAHIDHILGLPLFAPMFEPGRRIDIYCRSRGGLDGAAQLARFLSPPLWPVGLRELPADIVLHELRDGLRLGGVTVRCAEASHPGGSTLLRLERDGKSLVYATDHELALDGGSLASFARGADLLLCDAQTPDGEGEKFRGFGHSSAAEALELQKSCGAKRLLLIHHSPMRRDAELLAAQAALPRDAAASYAREGEVIEL